MDAAICCDETGYVPSAICARKASIRSSRSSGAANTEADSAFTLLSAEVNRDSSPTLAAAGAREPEVACRLFSGTATPGFKPIFIECHSRLFSLQLGYRQKIRSL